jgi:HD-GYP domain-containing protein (c-di-GMP phosphodiesterase class II)
VSVHKEKVLIQQLQFGMFIAELDRPWLDSPFLLQGFLLENDEQMNALKQLCEFVIVDRTKSVGDQFGERAKVDVSIKRTGFTSYKPTITTKSHKSSQSTSPKIVVKSTSTNQQKSIKNASFYEIMSAIKNGDVTESADGVVFNVREMSESTTSNTQDITPDITNRANEGTFAFLRNIFQKKERFKDTITSERARKNQDAEEDYRVIIHQTEAPSVELEMAVIYPTFAKSQKSIKSLFESIANAQKLDLSTVSEVLDSMVESISRTPDALMWLAKLKSSYDGAYNHALNVSINAMAFASFLAMPKSLIKDIGLGGLLQGIGKTVIPKYILEKTSSLTDAEYAIMKTHVEEGLKLLKNNPDIPATSLEMVAQHHERYDGSGYPKGLKDVSITTHGQIGGLVDTYCAMTTTRRHAYSINNMMALDEMRLMRGIEFSSDLIDQLIQFLGIYPVSSLVELNSGEVAVVIQQNQVRRLLPRVMVVLAEDKTKNKFPRTLDLLNSPQTPNGETYRIIRSLAPNSYGLNPNELYI